MRKIAWEQRMHEKIRVGERGTLRERERERERERQREGGVEGRRTGTSKRKGTKKVNNTFRDHPMTSSISDIISLTVSHSPVWSQISGPVVSKCARRFALLSNFSRKEAEEEEKDWSLSLKVIFPSMIVIRALKRIFIIRMKWKQTMGMKEEEQERMVITESASLIKVEAFLFQKQNITWMKTDSCDMAACLSFCHSMPRVFANLSRCEHLRQDPPPWGYFSHLWS